MIDVTDESPLLRLFVLQDFVRNNISLQAAVKELASISLSDATTTIEGGVSRLWNLIITFACLFPEHQDKLVNILVYVLKLPDAKTDQGEPLLLYNMQVWKDLPMFHWYLREEWNAPVVPYNQPNCQQEVITHFVNLNRFTALLMATEEPEFDFSSYALSVFRAALETPPIHLAPEEPHEAFVYAAAIWIEILGVEIYAWDEEFERGPKIGARGRGGPLWKGKHGFCEERWDLWRRRFGELARMEGKLGEEVRTTASEAEQMMKDIENGDVE